MSEAAIFRSNVAIVHARRQPATPARSPMIPFRGWWRCSRMLLRGV